MPVGSHLQRNKIDPCHADRANAVIIIAFLLGYKARRYENRISQYEKGSWACTEAMCC